MFGGRGLRRGARGEGPVAIPRGERVQLRRPAPGPSFETAVGAGVDEKDGMGGTPNSSLISSPSAVAAVPISSIEPKLPSSHEASKIPAWYGQTLEYAAGVSMRKQILEPILQDDSKALPEETARFLSYYSRGDLLFIQNASGAVHVANMERVTNGDAPTLAEWWEDDKFLPETGNNQWSDWWVRRCNLFDLGCEMVKLMGEDGEALGVAYFERNVVDNRPDGNGKRLTVIRGIRIHPKLNPEAIRRSSENRNAVAPIAYSSVASSLLHYILFASIRFGSHSVVVNSPKSDTIEDFYQHYFGLPKSNDPHDGRRFFRMPPATRFEILRQAFREQLALMQEYKDQMFLTKEEGEEADAVEHSVGGNGARAVDIVVPQLPTAGDGTPITVAVAKESLPLPQHVMEEASAVTVFVEPQAPAQGLNEVAAREAISPENAEEVDAVSPGKVVKPQEILPEADVTVVAKASLIENGDMPAPEETDGNAQTTAQISENDDNKTSPSKAIDAIDSASKVEADSVAVVISPSKKTNAINSSDMVPPEKSNGIDSVSVLSSEDSESDSDEEKGVTMKQEVAEDIGTTINHQGEDEDGEIEPETATEKSGDNGMIVEAADPPDVLGTEAKQVMESAPVVVLAVDASVPASVPAPKEDTAEDNTIGEDGGSDADIPSSKIVPSTHPPTATKRPLEEEDALGSEVKRAKVDDKSKEKENQPTATESTVVEEDVEENAKQDEPTEEVGNVFDDADSD